MLALTESEELKDPEFKWGIKRGLGGKNKAVRFYESFTYDGVFYALYDCVYMYKEDEPAPYIGKLVKIWETAQGLKKIKVQWFFRPSEISCYLEDVEVSENELFFASGDGKGVTNLNPLEAIAGKCNIVCTSPDSRNPQPSAEEIKMADYTFYRIFDVKSCTISDQMGDTIGGLEVHSVFNRRLSDSSVNSLLPESGGNCERAMVVCKEISDTASKNLPQQLNNSKLDIEGNHVLEKEDTHSMPIAVKQGSLDEKHISGVDVNSSKDREITGTELGERSTTNAKNVGINICKEKDKLKGRKLSVTQDHAGNGVKHARKSCDFDDAPSKRAKVNGLAPSDSNGVQGVKDSAGCRKDVNVSQSKENPNALQGKPSSRKEKLGSAHGKDSIVHDKPHENKDKKLDGDSCPEDEGYPKKAKLDNIVRQAKDNNDNNIKTSEEKNQVGETKEFPTGSYNAKSRLGEGHEKEKTRIGKNSSTSLTCDDKLKSKLKEMPSNENHNEKENAHVGKMRNSPKSLTCDDKAMSKHGEGTSKEYHDEKDGKLSNDKLPHSIATICKDDGGNVGAKTIEVTRRPHEKATWIKLTWEQQMKIGHEQGRLVLLQNLDPEYTSGDVEDIIWHAFREHCTARVLPLTAISNLHSGQALVVFKLRNAADRVVQKLDEGCLMLPNQRPLVACHGVLPKPTEKQTSYAGHLDISKDKRLISREMKEAVSTSHYSQHNTIEYDMAMEWCLLYSRSEKWWKSLYELQLKNLKNFTQNLKSN